MFYILCPGAGAGELVVIKAAASCDNYDNENCELQSEKRKMEPTRIL